MDNTSSGRRRPPSEGMNMRKNRLAAVTVLVLVMASAIDPAGVRVRPLAAEDLDEADRICRVAFGTFLGVSEPEKTFGDADMVRTRWRAEPGAALAADAGGRLAGSNFAANWGSVGFFGPLTVAPEYWDRAIAQRLLDATMDLFAAWGTRHAGLFTFAQSAKHVGLYQKYGFWPRFLTAIMSSPVRPGSGPASVRLSSVGDADRAGVVGCRLALRVGDAHVRMSLLPSLRSPDQREVEVDRELRDEADLD